MLRGSDNVDVYHDDQAGSSSAEPAEVRQACCTCSSYYCYLAQLAAAGFLPSRLVPV
jgi:hypothetical protein